MVALKNLMEVEAAVVKGRMDIASVVAVEEVMVYMNEDTQSQESQDFYMASAEVTLGYLWT
jgi:hypothetical protein